ncbi:uncharacterized protein DFL_009757 [Arthrobotrys flagrans]|uniref:Uncharacterized protein n=1 Tax=Arthrobotrys flagrans TaxID=97331 RepID=A0A436ZSJ6_ARTFL|nr:hypothetical protein DFL_009757 [Arthrobotrys flagrans]
MKGIYITVAALIAAAFAAPPVARSEAASLFSKRVCTPPTNCELITGCEYCCLDEVRPNGARCHLHLHDGEAEDCTYGGVSGAGIEWHCDDEHTD